MGQRPVRIYPVDQDDGISVVQVHGAGSNIELFVRTTGRLAADQSMWVPLVLPVAMRHGKSLKVHGVVDEQVLEGAMRAQDLLVSWWPTLKHVEITADATAACERRPGVGLAFSAGVDAFHSLYRNIDQVTHLWFVHGFDVPLWRSRLRAQIRQHLTQISEITGKSLVQVVTNVKPWADQYVRWGEIYHGAATAGLALGHSPLWGQALIASSDFIDDLVPWGSHPDLDPLWSSSCVEIVHDGVEVDRVDKVAAIAGWDLAMDHLRVCWTTPDQEYNCGACVKCVRTKINLIAAGGVSRTLPGDVTAGMIQPVHPDEATEARINLRHLRTLGVRADLADALEEALRRGPAAARRARAKDQIRALADAALRRR